MSSYNQKDLKPGNLNIGDGLCSRRVQRVLKSGFPAFKKTAQQRASTDIVWKQQFEKHQGKMEGRVFIHLRAWPGEVGTRGRPFQEQRSWQVPLISPTPKHKHVATCRNLQGTNTCYLSCLHQVISPTPEPW